MADSVARRCRKLAAATRKKAAARAARGRATLAYNSEYAEMTANLLAEAAAEIDRLRAENVYMHTEINQVANIGARAEKFLSELNRLHAGIIERHANLRAGHVELSNTKDKP